MASKNVCPRLETNMVSNSKVIKVSLRFKSARAHSKNDIKVELLLVHHLLHNILLLAIVKKTESDK